MGAVVVGQMRGSLLPGYFVQLIPSASHAYFVSNLGISWVKMPFLEGAGSHLNYAGQQPTKAKHL
jgi:hypothetical protein